MVKLSYAEMEEEGLSQLVSLRNGRLPGYGVGTTYIGWIVLIQNYSKMS